MGMKFCVLLIFLILPWISKIGDWALRWTEGNEELQVFFVMLFFPVIMNATQYYIIDSFIKKQKPGHEALAGEDEESEGGSTGVDDGSVDHEYSDDEEPAVVDEGKKRSKIKTKVADSKRRKGGLHINAHDYDPALDGESSPTAGGSKSGSSDEAGRLPRKDGDDKNSKAATGAS